MGRDYALTSNTRNFVHESTPRIYFALIHGCLCIVPQRGDQTDCQAQPCTCAAMDHRLYKGRQWGQDCSARVWEPQTSTSFSDDYKAPQCRASGVWAPVQVRYTALLYYIPPQERRQYRACSSPTGHQLFGKQLPGKEMDCACSVKRWELEQVKII